MARAKRSKKIPLVQSQNKSDIVQTLEGYRLEAEQNRKGGLNDRDTKWATNNDMYWNRVDFSTKADWQAKETMPEVPNFVDRFAAALKEALVSTPSSFYTVSDPYDKESDMGDAIHRMMDVWLSTIGRNQNGHLLGFPAVFEEQMKLGALMAVSGVMVWKEDVKYGRVAFETVSPYDVYLDHTYRNLYRVRHTEVDVHDLQDMLGMKSSKGNPIFDMGQMSELAASIALDRTQQKQQLTGVGQEITSKRKPVQLDEYLATVVDNEGKVVGERNSLFVVANNRYLIRGPEKNPYWHGRDWLVYAPLITTPMSVYGRSYMEDFGSLAKTFTELTNLLLDAIHMSAMNVFALVPSMLVNPNQANTGVWPNKTFLIEDGYNVKEFMEKLELGRLDQGSIQFWQAVKSELAEAAGVNEIGMGQLPEKTHIPSSAVVGAQQSQSAIIRSVAQTVETRFLDIALDLAWKTGLQNASPNDGPLAAAAGEEMYTALLANRRRLISHPITFQARGISMLIQKSQMLASLLNVLQVIGQNENLVAAFMQTTDPNLLIDLMLQLSNIDKTKLQMSERDKLIQSVTAPMQQAGAGGTASPTGLREMGGISDQLGIGKR